MIYAAVDVSGNQDEGNHKFMGIVLITEEHLKSTIRDMELKQIPISTFKQSKVRNTLSSKLEFNRKESAVFCLRIEQDKIINKIKKMIGKKHRKTPHLQIYQRYHQTVFKNIRDQIMIFGKNHNYELSDIIFQCDDDCKNFVRQNGLQYDIVGQKNLVPDKNHNNDAAYYDNETYAYVLSDLVAWSNNKGREPDGVISMNLADAIEKELIHAFR